MNQWTVYRLADGEIVRWIECPAGTEAAQIAEGEALLAGKWRPQTHRVVDGTAVPR